jgi:hypothetical protein
MAAKACLSRATLTWMNDKLQELARAIISRLDDAIYPVSRYPSFERPDGSAWSPTPHNCHSNVATLVHFHPIYKPINGHVLLKPILPFKMYWEIIAHAIVEDEDGTLIDITPHGASQIYPFVKHVGPNEEFDLVRVAVSVKVFV